MKHYFLINPAAGKGNLYRHLDGEIRTYCDQKEIDYEIYYTKGVETPRTISGVPAKKMAASSAFLPAEATAP